MIIQVSLQLLFHYCIINDQIGLSQLRWNLNIRQQTEQYADQSTEAWLLWHTSPSHDGCSISAGTWNAKCMPILLGSRWDLLYFFSLYELCHPDDLLCPVVCGLLGRLVLTRLCLPRKTFVLSWFAHFVMMRLKLFFFFFFCHSVKWGL